MFDYKTPELLMKPESTAGASNTVKQLAYFEAYL